MNLQENIRKVLREGVKEKMIDIIDSHGLMFAINFVGGWETLKELLVHYDMPTKYILGFIKELVKDHNGISIFNFDEDPIFYKETETVFSEITFFGSNGVIVQDWEKDTNDYFGEELVKYENLDDDIITDIFNFLVRQYEKGINKL